MEMRKRDRESTCVCITTIVFQPNGISNFLNYFHSWVWVCACDSRKKNQLKAKGIYRILWGKMVSLLCFHPPIPTQQTQCNELNRFKGKQIKFEFCIATWYRLRTKTNSTFLFCTASESISNLNWFGINSTLKVKYRLLRPIECVKKSSRWNQNGKKFREKIKEKCNAIQCVMVASQPANQPTN